MRTRPHSAPRHLRPRRQLARPAVAVFAVAALVLGACVAVVVVVSSGLAPAGLEQRSLKRDAGPRGGAGSPAAPSDAATSHRGAVVLPARGQVVRAAAVLRAWDERRARAWAQGDADALRDLYVDGAGATDVRLLRRYADRGFRVEGMTTQLLAVEVLEQAAARWRLRVTDRLASAVAVRRHEFFRLPQDRADTHVITLARSEDGHWRVARARPV